MKLEKPGQGRLKFASQDHPPVASSKIGVLIANLGTPDSTDYWSMRRYLSEFLSDKRVIDYPKWLWQPLLQLIILSKRPFSSGQAYKSIWNEANDESPLLTTSKGQLEKNTGIIGKNMMPIIYYMLCISNRLLILFYTVSRKRGRGAAPTLLE